jgi:hypothetical protein
MQDADHAKPIGQNDGGKIIGLSSSASFAPIILPHAGRRLPGVYLSKMDGHP